jgi:hypothetical protein
MTDDFTKNLQSIDRISSQGRALLSSKDFPVKLSAITVAHTIDFFRLVDVPEDMNKSLDDKCDETNGGRDRPRSIGSTQVGGRVWVL